MNTEKLFHVILAPHVSEKSTRVAEKSNQIVFRVRRDASKPDIKAAVEKMFNVQVESVSVVNVRGKTNTGTRFVGPELEYFRAKPGLRAWTRRLRAGGVEVQSMLAGRLTHPDGPRASAGDAGEVSA